MEIVILKAFLMYYLLYQEMKYAFPIVITLKHTSTIKQKAENCFISLLFLNLMFANLCLVANIYMS